MKRLATSIVLVIAAALTVRALGVSRASGVSHLFKVGQRMLPSGFSHEAAQIMREANAVDCMRFRAAGVPPFGPAVGYYSGYELAEEERPLHASEARYFASIVLSRLSYRENPPGTMCLFDPHHASRYVTEDGREVAVIVCFQCSDLIVMGGGDTWGGRFEPAKDALHASFERIVPAPVREASTETVAEPAVAPDGHQVRS